MDPETRIRRNPQVVHREIAGQGGVLLHLESGAYHGVNEVGTIIWELLGEERTFAGLVAELGELLLDPPADLAGDTERFLADLRERDLIAG